MRGIAAATGLIVLLSGSATPDDPDVTFSHDIAPIFYKNCAECHRSGGIGPMPLVEFQQARPWAKSILQQVQLRKMPPWKPEPGYGSFLGARVLAPEDIELIRRWVKAGAPEGNPAELPALPKTLPTWELGEPDLVVTMSEAFDVPAGGPDIFRCFVLPLNLPSDRYVRAFEFQPGNRRVLHHSILFLDRTGSARKLDAADAGPGYASFGGPGFFPTGALGGWSPGSGAVVYPAGATKSLRAPVDLVLHSHYHPSGERQQDQSRVGIYFAKSPSDNFDITIPVLQQRLLIPAGDPLYAVTTFLVLPVDVQLVSISPHMHYLGREMKIWATLPEGGREPLIHIKAWDVGWQGVYRYEHPVTLPRGTRIQMEAVFDNSANNPRNPFYPPRVVRWGENSRDEMALCLLEAVVHSDPDVAQLQRAIVSQPGLGSVSKVPQ